MNLMKIKVTKFMNMCLHKKFSFDKNEKIHEIILKQNLISKEF